MAQQTLDEFETSKAKRGFKPDSSMLERWNSRIVPQGLDRLGQAGAVAYLERYGHNIGLDKVIKLAQTAEAFGKKELAEGFWRHAYQMAHGAPPPRNGLVHDAAVAVETFGEDELEAHAGLHPAITSVRLSDLPEALQPGLVSTMQPVDAKQDRTHYIGSNAYLGQPKRNGERRLAFVTAAMAISQGRSSRVGTFPPAIDTALTNLATIVGSLVLDGELWYEAADGSEQINAARAAALNVQLGKGEVAPVAHYSVFDLLYAQGKDWRESCQMDRLTMLEMVLDELAPGPIEYLAPVFGTKAKAALAALQVQEGREGEIWRHINGKYIGGKTTATPELIVRTKYTIEMEVVVTGLTEAKTVDPTFLFGAIKVADPQTMADLGSVGTGFTRADQAEIVKRFNASAAAGAAPFMIKVESRGMTENGKLWHPAVIGF